LADAVAGADGVRQLQTFRHAGLWTWRCEDEIDTAKMKNAATTRRKGDVMPMKRNPLRRLLGFPWATEYAGSNSIFDPFSPERVMRQGRHGCANRAAVNAMPASRRTHIRPEKYDRPFLNGNQPGEGPSQIGGIRK
jgi:hypothetical protein